MKIYKRGGPISPLILNVFFNFILLFLLKDAFSLEIEKEKTINLAIQEKLYDNPIWNHLIHYNGGRSSINDSNFILSYGNFSPKQELINTINLIYEDKEKACQFPARILFIKTLLKLPDSFFSLDDCKEFIEYETLAPSDSIYLVFASENVKDPTSMMGHTFFKFVGKRNNEEIVEHAISFFAVINNKNIITLVVDAFFNGMDGIFSLSPYKKAIRKYLLEEDRNIWEFELDLDEFEKKLIRYHIFELRYVKPKYYFVSYNCATIVYEILLLSKNFRETVNNEKYIWLTPQDIVKLAYKSSIIKRISLVPSIRWKIRLLSDKNLCIKKDLNVDTDCFSNLDDDQKFLSTELLNDLAVYFYLSGKIKENDYYSTVNLANQLSSNNPTKVDLLNLEKYKNPINSLEDSQFSLGLAQFFGDNFLNLKILPTYSKLSDVNMGSFTESSVALFETSVLLNNKKLIIDYVRFLETNNLVPWNRYIGGISTKFSIGLDNHLNKDLNNKLSLYLTYSIGQTFKISQSYYQFFLVGGGLGYRNNLYIYGEPTLGAIIYLSNRLKSMLYYSFVAGQINRDNYYHRLVFSQTILVNKNLSIFAELKYFKNKEEEKTVKSLNIVFFF